RSFVKNLSEDETAKAIANTIISMAKTMNMKSTAEGVETEEQLNFLKDRGCDQIQGYLISKPTEPLLFEKEFFK
ncbi:MAG TPA: GGDEF domain-containing response regulator, partial [Clostridiaceae bacterium]|nr:GGDEF domain-containing response regulator [Clostridiaceae bacterium]